MGKDWLDYQCKSGQTLFVYNKVTGEHKWPHWLPEGMHGKIMYGHPVEYKEYRTIAIQTNDNGCNNGCMSMYINADLPCSSSTSTDALPQQQRPDTSNEGMDTLIDTCEVQSIEPEDKDEQEEGENIDVVTANQSHIVDKDYNHDNDHSENSLTSTDHQADNSSLFNIADRSLVDNGCGDEDIVGHCGDSLAQGNDVNVHGSEDHQSDQNDRAAEEHFANLHVNSTEEKNFQKNKKTQNYQCGICKKVLKSKIFLQRHYVVHNGEKRVECSICKKKISKYYLATHLRIHTGEKPFECVVCNKKFTHKQNLKQHANIHTGEKPFECVVCNKKFTHKQTLKQHANIHTGEKPFECSVCKKTFVRRINLKEHVKIHTGEKPFECSVCKKKFVRRINLKEHVKIHTGEKPFECSVCKKKFLRKNKMKEHVKIHTGEKPFECSVCKKKFVRRDNLKEHVKIHTGEKPFECSVCKKKFVRRDKLKEHVKIHTGEKPFECSVCEEKFSHRQSLKDHTRTHTGEKPFE